MEDVKKLFSVYYFLLFIASLGRIVFSFLAD